MKTKLKMIGSVILAGLLLLFGIYLKLDFERIKEEKRREELYTVKNKEEVIEFIDSFGYICDEILSYNKRIPAVFGDVYNEYNKIQKIQGFNLESYKGEDVVIYKAIIKDSDDGSYITVITSNNIIIGYSIHSDLNEGFIKPLQAVNRK